MYRKDNQTSKNTVARKVLKTFESLGKKKLVFAAGNCTERCFYYCVHPLKRRDRRVSRKELVEAAAAAT